jgi:hypothetical protein
MFQFQALQSGGRSTGLFGVQLLLPHHLQARQVWVLQNDAVLARKVLHHAVATQVEFESNV